MKIKKNCKSNYLRTGGERGANLLAYDYICKYNLITVEISRMYFRNRSKCINLLIFQTDWIKNRFMSEYLDLYKINEGDIEKNALCAIEFKKSHK